MDIVARVPGKNEKLHLILEKQGYRVKPTNTAIIVYLPKEKDDAYTIPKELIEIENKFVFAYLKETNTDSYAQIICSPQGETIRPYYIHGKDAYFAIRWGAAIIYVSKNKKGQPEISIQTIKIKRINNKVYISRWDIIDEVSELPASHSCYKNAVRAAISKMNCINCSEPHYIRTK